MDGTTPRNPVIAAPLDLVRLCLDERVIVKAKGNRELRGILHAYDPHLNIFLSDVEEIHSITEVDEETLQLVPTCLTRKFPTLFVRGDSIITLAPCPKTNSS